MPSQARIDAGHANGKKGAGKHTAAGKTRSALNALKHGLTAATATAGLLPGEDPAAYRRHLQAQLRLFQPADDFEFACVLRIHSGLWRLARLAAAETGALELAMQSAAAQLDKDYEHADAVVRLGAAFQKFSAVGTMANFARYETALTRSIARARHDLDEYRRFPPAPQPNLRNEGNAATDPGADAAAGPAVYAVLDAPPPSLHARARALPLPNEGNPAPLRASAVHQTLPHVSCETPPPLQLSTLSTEQPRQAVRLQGGVAS